MSKFKIGDKVKILPNALCDGVGSEAFNKIGKITNIGFVSCSVSMDDKQYNNGGHDWAVSLCNIAPSIVKGEQLLFDFMTP